jgi:pimeloyl-ACP methyl ester carboxylesterase
MRTMDTVPTLPTPARRRRRWSWILAAVVVLLAVGTGTVYAAGGYLAYEELSVVHPHCGSRPFATQTPADFTVTGGGAADAAGLDITPYRFSDFSEVEFPTRGGGLTIRAWYAPPRQAGGPVVVVVHGRDACRRDWSVLLPAGMLHRAGFGVVLPDLRNHGDSDIDNGRWAGGAKEYLDVLGAWDWLRGRGVAAERIGLVGMSLGAATVTIATGEEPAVAATWADSPYATYGVAAAEYADSSRPPRSRSSPAGRSSSSRASTTRRSARTTRSTWRRPRRQAGPSSSRGSSRRRATPARSCSSPTATRRG